MEESHVYNTSEITCNLHFQYLMCIAGLVFFFLGNCLNFISFGYAAQVSVDKHAYKFFPLLPFPLLMTTPIHSLHDWSNICHSASLSFLFLFFILSLSLTAELLCSHFLQPWDRFSLYPTLLLPTSCWTKWWLLSMLKPEVRWPNFEKQNNVKFHLTHCYC